jgi:WhiB family redox-sensing transcriptional regulator
MDPTGTITLIAKILTGSPQLPGATCRDHGDIFDPDGGDLEVALMICRACPVLAECAAWCTALPRSKRPVGVVAGTVHHHPADKPTKSKVR